jgi:hypothetical protein
MRRHEYHVINPRGQDKYSISFFQYGGHNISKSKQDTQLNGNPFFSKDKLTKVQNSFHVNNNDDYLNVGELHIIIFGYWVGMMCIFCA